MPRCPECAGIMKYSRIERKYVCRSCGVAMTMDAIWEARDRQRSSDGDSREDYLEWWLSRKK